MLKVIFAIFGTIALTLGLIGIFIPGLPTTPFLLLAAALYVRSSQKLYEKLIRSKYIGPKIESYRKNKGMTLMLKLWSIFLMWIMIGISVHFFLETGWVKVVIIGLGLTGSAVMGFIVPTIKKKE